MIPMPTTSLYGCARGPADALAILREVNANLRAALLRLRPERKSCASIKRGELSALLAQLLRAADCLRQTPAHGQADADPEQASCEPEHVRADIKKTDFEKRGFEKDADLDEDADFEKEKSDYRRNLELLKQFLPGLHVRLLAEKARLEAARLQVSAAAAWARVSAKTL